jgi:hypothetical protein
MQQEPEFNQPEVNPPTYDWVLGLGLLLLLHLVQIPLAAMTLGLSLIVLGLSQLAYVIPAVILARRRGRPGIAKGLIIGAALTFLLNGTCTIYFFSQPMNFH